MSYCERARQALQVQVRFVCNPIESEPDTATKWVGGSLGHARHDIEFITTIITNSLDVSQVLATSMPLYWFTHISDHYQFRRCHYVRHNGGRCDTGENAGHLETLQTINMAEQTMH